MLEYKVSTEQGIDIAAKVPLPLSIYPPIFRGPSLLGLQLQRAPPEPHRHEHPSDLPDLRAGDLVITVAGFGFRCGFRCGFGLQPEPARVFMC